MTHADTISLLQSGPALAPWPAADNLQSFGGKRLSAWILTDGKAGDRIPCLGLAEVLGLRVIEKIIAPRKFFGFFAPFGPIDPKDRMNNRDSFLRPPWPDLAIASGRRAVPYLRYVKNASNKKVFTVFLKNPRIQNHGADVLWAPAHDGLSGPNIISTLIAPHMATPARLNAARKNPDARCVKTPSPRLAVFVGGDSNSHTFSEVDVVNLVRLVSKARENGMGVMITPSRRTPETLKRMLRDRWSADSGVFYWNGEGENPYASMLALADGVVVTADSTNMIGEVLATSAPVQIFEPSGGHARLTAFVDALEQRGAARRWRGEFAFYRREPFDETPLIAAAIAQRYKIFTERKSIL